jgi:hypothetical protein
MRATVGQAHDARDVSTVTATRPFVLGARLVLATSLASGSLRRT